MRCIARVPVILGALVISGSPAIAIESGEDTGSSGDTGSPSYVVGGSQVSKGDWEDTAGIVMGGYVGCTGTLVAPDVVLTAGHCLGGITAVILGTNNYSSGGEQIRVKSEHEYPNSWLTIDVGVLILEEESSITPRVIAQDCVLDELEDGAPVTIVGYGATDIWGQEYGSKLMEAETTVNDHDCSNLSSGCNSSVSPGGEISAGGGGIDACYGDSGGPLYLNSSHGDFLIGVTSRSYANVWAPCEEGGIYGRADAVVDWIESTTGRTLEEPDCDGGGAEGGGSGGGGGTGGDDGGGSGGDGGAPDTDGNQTPEPWAAGILVVEGKVGRTRIQVEDPDVGDTHSFYVVKAPYEGITDVTADGLVVYDASGDWTGEDVIEVVVVDAAGEEAVAAIALQVEPRLDDDGSKGCSAAALAPVSGLLCLTALLGLVRRQD